MTCTGNAGIGSYVKTEGLVRHCLSLGNSGDPVYVGSCGNLNIGSDNNVQSALCSLYGRICGNQNYVVLTGLSKPYGNILQTFCLEDDINGSYAVWDFDGDTNYFTSSNNKTDFKIKVHFDLDTYWNEPLRLNEKQLGIEAVSTDTLEQRVLRNVVIYSQFQAYDKEGRPDYGATLYMQDQTDADIIFE